jgi:hypothetical protein
MRVAVGLCVVVTLLSSVARADGQPQPKDTAAVQSCVKAKGGHRWRWETCIGVVSEPCAKDEGSMRDTEVSACYDRERAVWDAVLNESFLRLRAKLDDEQQGKLRDMQRAWIANPMIAACLSRETGRRALYLLGFADDAEGK